MRIDQSSFGALNNHTKSYASLNKSRAKYSFDKESNEGSIKE